ncbi:MAG: phytoene desaturase [Myxococcales bacterium]|nr:phytoene desaturase [Myxococcales bacterium]
MGTVAENGTVVVIGGGVGGLCSAIRAASAGCRVVLLERAATIGGKMRVLGPREIDAGPTVLTMRWAFDQLFTAAGRDLGDYVELVDLEILARHAWPDGGTLDLFADPERTAEAIAAFAGPKEAEGYRRFRAHTARIFSVVEQPFLRSKRPSLVTVATAKGLRGILEFASIDWHRSMWQALASFFTEPRLRQLFGRYATYYGSSPFRAPATLNLIAHVEAQGVWRVAGGMSRLARGLETLAKELGVEIRTSSAVERVDLGRDGAVQAVRLHGGERVPAAAVIVNAAPQALDAGLLGEHLRGCVGLRDAPRSLSAVTWALRAPVTGALVPAHHNVCFSSDYPEEFRSLERGELPEEPTVYVCAQDRSDDDDAQALERERLLVLVNAPALGDRGGYSPTQLDDLQARSFDVLRRCGFAIDLAAADEPPLRTEPRDFEDLFPATGGALYGTGTHAMMAPFHRPAARTSVRGLYLAGGGAHPGAGVPMVCLSGQLAAEAVLGDFPTLARGRRSA